MITTALFLLSIVVFYIGRLLIKQNEEIIQLLTEKKPKEIEFKGAPNSIAKKPTDDISFEENNPLSIPRDVKFQVEGGDSLLPFGFDEPSPNRIIEE